jgi:hypothetical protein
MLFTAAGIFSQAFENGIFSSSRRFLYSIVLIIIHLGCFAQNSTDLFFSEYVEGFGNNQALEIFNPGGSSADLSEFRIVRSNDGGGWEIWHSFPKGFSLSPKSVWTIANNQFTAPFYDLSTANEQDLSPFIAFRGNDAIGLMKVSALDTLLIDVIGLPDTNPGSGWDVAGILSATANHTLIRRSDITTGNTSWDKSRGNSSFNSEWIVKDYDFADSLGHHYFKPVIMVSSIVLSAPGSPIININQGSLPLKADLIPANTTNPLLFWSSSDPKIASVDQNGLVKAFNNGTTWVRSFATDGSGVADSINILVTNQIGFVPVSSITLSSSGGNDTISLNQGILKLLADVLPANASDMTIIWSVDNSLLAGISADGILTAKKNGEVIITAASSDGSRVIARKTIFITGQFFEINSLSELRAAYTPDHTIYKIKAEVVLNHFIYYRNTKYVQDATAGIQIDDEPGVIMTAYNAGDGITGLTGTLEDSYGMLILHPIEDPGAASSQNNTLEPLVISIKDLSNNFEAFESRLIKINSLLFDQAGSKFVNLSNYTVKSGIDATILRTEFSNSDFLGSIIPDSANVIGIAIEFNMSIKIAPRKLSDFEVLPRPANIAPTKELDFLRIYPNPVDNELHVSSATELKSFEIRDVTGRVIFTKRPLDPEKTVDTSGLPSGVYFITFYNGNYNSGFTFIKL